MNQIKKHAFEAVSLLTADNGLLDVTVVPAMNQPDWLIPSNLILDIVTYDERVWTYLWNGQEIAVFHLTPRELKPAKVIILEGNTDVHRIALQTVEFDDLQHMRVRISNVKDVDMPVEYLEINSHKVISDETQADLIDTENTEVNEEQPVDESDTNQSDADQQHDNHEHVASDNQAASHHSKQTAGLMSVSDGHFDENQLNTYTFQCVEVNGEIYLVPDLDKIAHHLVDLDG